MNLKSIEKEISHIIPHQHGDKYSRVDPHGQWKVILVCFTLASLAVAAWSAYFFYEVKSGDIFSTAGVSGDTNASLDRVKLDAIVKRFDDASAHGSAIKSARPVYADPSR